MNNSALTLDAHFANGQAFLDEYQSFLGSLTIAKRGNPRRATVGDRVTLRCRFGNETPAHEWQGLLISSSVKTRARQDAYAVKLDPMLLGDVERVVWSHVREMARGEIRLKPTFPLRIIVRRAGSSISQALFAQDVSRGGCQLVDEANVGFAPSDAVILRWGSGETLARVRWARGCRFGLMFDPPLPLQEVSQAPKNQDVADFRTESWVALPNEGHGECEQSRLTS